MNYSALKYPNSSVTIRDVQCVAFEIVCEIDRVCRELAIPYQLFAGTLLGAVRHKGFIPWDDDVDVCMLRADWERFLALAPAILRPEFFLQTDRTDSEYENQYAKVRRNGTVFREHTVKDKGIHHGIFVDVFALDAIRPGTLMGLIQRRVIETLRRIRYWNSLEHIHPHAKGVKSRICRTICGVFRAKRLSRWESSALQWFNDDADCWVSHLQNGASYRRYYAFMFRKMEFSDMIETEFEGRMFPAPRAYDERLRAIYGDYMKWPPEQNRRPQHPAVEVRLYESGTRHNEDV